MAKALNAGVWVKWKQQQHVCKVHALFDKHTVQKQNGKDQNICMPVISEIMTAAMMARDGIKPGNCATTATSCHPLQGTLLKMHFAALMSFN